MIADRYIIKAGPGYYMHGFIRDTGALAVSVHQSAAIRFGREHAYALAAMMGAKAVRLRKRDSQVSSPTKETK